MTSQTARACVSPQAAEDEVGDHSPPHQSEDQDVGRLEELDADRAVPLRARAQEKSEEHTDEVLG